MLASNDGTPQSAQVTKDDVIVADKIDGADIGTTMEVGDVLLVGTREETLVGRPLVKGASVKLLVEEQTKDKKVGARRRWRAGKEEGGGGGRSRGCALLGFPG